MLPAPCPAPVQLRWGDYDSHDVERYTRAKFLDYTTDNMVGGDDLPAVLACYYAKSSQAARQCQPTAQGFYS